MNFQPKLRMSVGFYYPMAILTCYIITILEWGIRRELIREGSGISHFPFMTYFICGVFFIGMGIFQYFKYRHWIYPVIGILVGLLCFQGPYAISTHIFIMKAGYFITLIVLGLFVILNWSVVYGQERYEINARRLFRLASARIRETGNGFTGRPYAAGDIGPDSEQIAGFTRFLEGKYIARAFHEADNHYLAFSMNKTLFSVEHPQEVSHVCISRDGRLSVFIAQADYREFKRSYNFDQLCDSLGLTFRRFFDYYNQGLESRIVTELKSAR